MNTDITNEWYFIFRNVSRTFSAQFFNLKERKGQVLDVRQEEGSFEYRNNIDRKGVIIFESGQIMALLECFHAEWM